MLSIYVDGSSRNLKNKIYGGIGIVFIKKKKIIKEISRFIGGANSNYTELIAIFIALSFITDYDEKIIIYSDSLYAVKVVNNNYIKVKESKQLIFKIRNRLKSFSNIKIEWVKGHNGDIFNERANFLARQASGLGAGIYESSRLWR